MKVLSVKQPWASHIMHGTKTCENRDWHPGKALAIGERFAIHATKHDKNWRNLWLELPFMSIDQWHEYNALVAARSRVSVLEELKFGLILGTCTFRGAFPYGSPEAPREETFTNHSHKYSAYHWHVTDPEWFADPIPAKGKLRIWHTEEKGVLI